jgi:hypothetical protein
MADPNHAELIEHIHSSEREIDALENKIANSDDATTIPADYSAMRTQQEEHRQRILKCKSDIDLQKWPKSKRD